MNTAQHLSPDDLALFALQLLPEAEMRAASLHLQQCTICRSQVGEFQGDLVLLSLLPERQAPPAGARERLLRTVAQEKRAVNTAAPSIEAVHSDQSGSLQENRGAVLPMAARGTPHGLRGGLLSWSGWALAAGFAVAAFLQSQERHHLQAVLSDQQARLAQVQDNAAASEVAVSALTDPAALHVTLRQTSTEGAEAPLTPEAHAAYLPDRGALVFVASNLRPLEPYKVYELWLLPAEKGSSPIPAGSFRPDSAGNANLLLPTGPRLAAIHGFGVTVEKDDAVPKQPTLPILLMGSSRS